MTITTNTVTTTFVEVNVKTDTAADKDALKRAVRYAVDNINEQFTSDQLSKLNDIVAAL